MNIEIAEIYRDAGLRQAAIDAFYDASGQAYQENDDELYQKLISEMEKLERISD